MAFFHRGLSLFGSPEPILSAHHPATAGTQREDWSDQSGWTRRQKKRWGGGVWWFLDFFLFFLCGYVFWVCFWIMFMFFADFGLCFCLQFREFSGVLWGCCCWFLGFGFGDVSVSVFPRDPFFRNVVLCFLCVDFLGRGCCFVLLDLVLLWWLLVGFDRVVVMSGKMVVLFQTRLLGILRCLCQDERQVVCCFVGCFWGVCSFSMFFCVYFAGFLVFALCSV